MADEKHGSFEDTGYGIGQNADGTFNIFPASELKERLAQRAREEAETPEDVDRRANEEREAEIAALEDESRDDDLSDLPEAESAFGTGDR